MYAVVGCGECEALWIVETGADSSQCPRCGTTRPLAKRTKLATADSEPRARDQRTALLADRHDVEDAPSFTGLDGQVDAAGPGDAAYLAGSGVDPDAAAAAGERAEDGAAGTSSSDSQRAIVEAALAALDAPTEGDVLTYASERAVPEETARSILERLLAAGEVVEDDGCYRQV